jgi:phosphoribosylglycinamide formyltransferase-1
MLNRKARIAVLVSGGGTNLQAILDAQHSGVINSGEVVLVISNNRDAYALTRAANAGIEGLYISKKELNTQEAFETAMIDALESHGIDLIVLAGFLSILSERFTSRYPKRIINIHPALIPSFCGKGYYGLKVHEAALRKGVKITGATVHFVNEIPDGGEIIAQKAVQVHDGDTPETLQRRVMEEAEWIILPQAIEKVAQALSD